MPICRISQRDGQFCNIRPKTNAVYCENRLMERRLTGLFTIPGGRVSPALTEFHLPCDRTSSGLRISHSTHFNKVLVEYLSCKKCGAVAGKASRLITHRPFTRKFFSIGRIVRIAGVFQEPVQCGAINPQNLSRPCLVASSFIKNLVNVCPVYLRQSEEIPVRRGVRFLLHFQRFRQIPGINHLRIRQHACVAQHIFQFTDIAGPGVARENNLRPRGNSPNRLRICRQKTFQE